MSNCVRVRRYQCPRITYVFTLIILAGCAAKQERAALVESTADSVFVKQGDQIIAATFDTLRNSLLSAISASGFVGAIEFCNEKAVALTSLYADTVKVRRTALRYRNPANAPDSLERAVLLSWAGGMRDGRRPTPELIRRSDGVHYFKPIMMQAMCTNCHGARGVNIQESTMAAVRQRYPKDMAIDFSEGDLRGSWHVLFRKQKE